MNDRTTHMSLVQQAERKEAERTEWQRVLGKGPQPHHNVHVRDLEGFAGRQRERMKQTPGWWPIKQRGETLPDYLLAIAIGLALALLLFLGLSS